MTDPGELSRALLAVAEILDARGVRWAIGGSLASAAHGEPRATNDVDLVASLSEADARALASELVATGHFYADPDAAVDAVRRRSSFNVIDTRSFIKIDVFVPRAGALGTGQLDRACRLDIVPASRPLPVLGAEDIVLQKLNWYRAGGSISDRQWRDLVSVLRLAGDLDDAYLDAVASSEGLDELLATARADARS
jgi:hypothetical protein